MHLCTWHVKNQYKASVNVTRQGDFVDATADQRIIKEIFKLQLEIKK